MAGWLLKLKGPFWLVNSRCLGFPARWNHWIYCWWLNHHPVLSQIGSSSPQIKAKRLKVYLKSYCRNIFWNDHLVVLMSPKWELLGFQDPLPVLAISSVPNLSRKVLPMAGSPKKAHTHCGHVFLSFQLFQYIGFRGWTSPPRRRFRCSNAFRLAPEYHEWNDLNGLSQVTWSTWIWREFCIFLLMILDDIWWYETLQTY